LNIIIIWDILHTYRCHLGYTHTYCCHLGNAHTFYTNIFQVSQLYEKLYLNHEQEVDDDDDKEETSHDPVGSSQSDVINRTDLNQCKDLDVSGELQCDGSDELNQKTSIHLEMIGSDVQQNRPNLKRSDWLRTWVDPVLISLCNGSRVQKKCIIEVIYLHKYIVLDLRTWMIVSSITDTLE